MHRRLMNRNGLVVRLVLFASIVLGGTIASAVTLTYNAQTLGTQFTQELIIEDTPIVFDVAGVTHWQFPITASTTTTAAGTQAASGSFIGAKFEAFNNGADLHYHLTFPIAPILAGEPLIATHEVLINSFQPPALAFNGADAALALQITQSVDLFAQIVEGATVFDWVNVDPSSIVVVPEPSASLLVFASLLLGARLRRR